MSETSPSDDIQEKFPDAEVPKYTNCFGYLYYKLGLENHLGSEGIYPTYLKEEYFQEVDSILEADAVGFMQIGTHSYEHAVFVDKKKNRRLFHRPNASRPVEETDLEKLKKIYSEENFKVVFLKKKEKSNIRLILDKWLEFAKRRVLFGAL